MLQQRRPFTSIRVLQMTQAPPAALPAQVNAASPGATSALRHLAPGWYAIVMGLAGLSLAWHAAAPVLDESARQAGLALGGLAALVFITLLVAGLWRRVRCPGAWGQDLQHPVRHAFVAAIPIGLLLLVTSAWAAGLGGRWLEPLWWLACLAQLCVTVWVMSRWWRIGPGGGLPWASLTPALFVPIVGNVLVPLAGVPLGRMEWAAAQFGIGVLFWPVVLGLLLARIAHQGPWPERLLPAHFILVAPPSVVGLSALRFGMAPQVAWALWGVALFSLLWVLPLLRRILQQPFSVVHWGMSFPMAAFTTLTLKLLPSGPGSLVGVALLALTSLLVAGLSAATLRGLRWGTLLVPETVPITTPPANAAG
jgi:tellurite resistance protein